jgi:hypothetical protein
MPPPHDGRRNQPRLAFARHRASRQPRFDDALKYVYRHTSAKLFGVCLRILNDREEAEDVLQDVYLTVWNKADRFDAGKGQPDHLAGQPWPATAPSIAARAGRPRDGRRRRGRGPARHRAPGLDPGRDRRGEAVGSTAASTGWMPNTPAPCAPPSSRASPTTPWPRMPWRAPRHHEKLDPAQPDQPARVSRSMTDAETPLRRRSARWPANTCWACWTPTSAPRPNAASPPNRPSPAPCTGGKPT